MNSLLLNDTEALNLRWIDEGYHRPEETKEKEKVVWQTISFTWRQF